VYFDIYAEGGPLIQVQDPTSIEELLAHANEWSRSLTEEPDRYARPYEWTMSPITIALGPAPPNAIDYQHAQDVLTFCARERTSLLDQVNEAEWYLENQGNYDWTTTTVTVGQLSEAVRMWQLDLNTLARAASVAMNDTLAAKLPAVYAQQVEGRQYRQTVMPEPMPKPMPQQPSAPTVPVPIWQTEDMVNNGGTVTFASGDAWIPSAGEAWSPCAVRARPWRPTRGLRRARARADARLQHTGGGWLHRQGDCLLARAISAGLRAPA
jgi:hypothetical protein